MESFVTESGQASLRTRVARSATPWQRHVMRLTTLLAGLFILAVALVLGLQSNLGADCWTVFQDAISRHTPLTIGQASQLVGLVMLGIGWAAGIRPGVGTVLNMILVGLFMDLILAADVIDLAGPYPLRVGMLLAAIALIGLGTGLYLKAGYGAGPRDGVNLALMRLFGWPIGRTRWLVESTVAVIGIALGGRFGIGTIIFALLIGPAVSGGFKLVGLPQHAADPRRQQG